MMNAHIFPNNVDPNALHDALNESVIGFRVVSDAHSPNGNPTATGDCGSVYSTDEDITIFCDDNIGRDAILKIIDALLRQ